MAFTVHSVATPDLADPQQAGRRTRLGRVKMLLVLLVCASPVIASYLTYYVIRPEGRSHYGELILPVRELPAALPLSTLEGAAVPPASLRRQWLLVVVAPARCDAACEARLLMQRQLREMLGRERDRLDKLVLVPDDGGAPAQLQPKLQQALATAPAATVLRVPRAALQAWLAPAVGHALEDHLYIVDPMGQWMMRMPANAEPQRVMRDLSRLLRASSFWDEPGR